jgi:DNA modification methylase
MSDNTVYRVPPARNRVYCANALDLLASMPDGSVDLIVTSPPYDNLRTYKGYTFDFESIARETYRVMKPGGVVVWVVGDATVKGSETLTSMRQALYFVDVCGFRMHDTMIWHKDGSPSPQVNRYLQTFEFMFVLSKGAPTNATPIRQLVKSHAGKSATFQHRGKPLSGFDYSPGDGTRNMDNVWYIPCGYMKTTKDADAYEHPAMFPETLAERHILTWSNAGDLVVDFFAGSGTTAKMARKNGRDFIACDISADYCDLMRKRLFDTPYTPSFLPALEAQEQAS